LQVVGSDTGEVDPRETLRGYRARTREAFSHEIGDFGDGYVLYGGCMHIGYSYGQALV
jgi:hypothetical protein